MLLVNNHLETTGLSLEDRRQFKNLVIGKLEVDTAEETSKLLVVKLAEATKKRAPEAEAVAKYLQQHKGTEYHTLWVTSMMVLSLMLIVR